MAELTKEYFEQQMEKYGQMIVRSFESVDKRFDTLDKKIDKIEGEIKALSAKITAHLELSDKRYLELKRRDIVIAKWIKQIGDKTGVEIDLAELEKF